MAGKVKAPGPKMADGHPRNVLLRACLHPATVQDAEL